MSDKTWSGRFSEPVSDLVKRYTASVDFDQRMAAQDIRGSLAHARMLARQGIIAAADLTAIERGHGANRAARSSAANSNGASMPRMCTSTSRSA